jgi:hypothetical protein
MLSRIRRNSRLFLASAAFITALSPAYAQAPGYVLPPGSTVQKQLYAAPAAAPPTCTNCTIETGSTDFMGQFSVTSTGNVALTFGTQFTNTPYCVMSDNTSHEGITGAATSSGVTVGGGTTSDLISWICVGH